MPRCMGVDFGDRRIGLALSDPDGRMAFPRETVEHAGPIPEAAKRVAKWAREWEVERIVVGLALGMDGTRGKSADRIASFAGLLRKELGGLIEVVMLDERLSTVQASRLLHDAGMNAKKQKSVIDMMAASVLLQAYLDGLPRPPREFVDEGGQE